MTTVRKNRILAVIAISLIASGCATTPVPNDAQSTCNVPVSQINGWFHSGSVTLNGVVDPANSVTFSNAPNCDFYKWSEQMFLWANSPAPATYGGGNRVFNSQAFFDVSDPDAMGQRTFIGHPSNAFALRNLMLRVAKPGFHGLPVIMSKDHRLFEIDLPPVSPAGKQLILNSENQPVEIARIELPEADTKKTQPATRTPTFFDNNGAVIKGAHPLFRESLQRANKDLLAQKFIVGKTPVFLNSLGAAIETEQGQADGSVLMAQNGSLVYYGIFANDVFAYFTTGVKDNVIAATHFPTTNADLTAVKNFAISHGLPTPDPFPDSVALAVELKTSWVEASGVADPSHYISMNATIPTYDTSNPNDWVPNGSKTVKMVMTAMHVVGSTAGHPEMIWATFEHENNAPNATYNYNSTTGPKSVNPNFSQAFLFCAASPDQAHLNEPHMQMGSGAQNGHIVAMSGFTVSPSNTIRSNAFGAAFGVGPNPLGNDAFSNSELIKVNTDVRSALDPNDVRRRYIMTGSTWTIGGAGFNGNFGNPGNTAVVAGRGVGTSQMANTTLETYQQGFPSAFSNFGNNCFSCHGTNTTAVSHIFGPLQPLF
jgi:hypothetical protein